MSSSIGGVVLDHTPLWIDKNKYPDAIVDISNAIDGSEILMINSREKCFPITLESTRETGWLKGSTVDLLRVLSTAGGYYTLNLNGTEYIVRFRNEESGGAIQMETLTPHSDPDENTWWIGKIYLMCVG